MFPSLSKTAFAAPLAALILALAAPIAAQADPDRNGEGSRRPGWTTDWRGQQASDWRQRDACRGGSFGQAYRNDRWQQGWNDSRARRDGYRDRDRDRDRYDDKHRGKKERARHDHRHDHRYAHGDRRDDRANWWQDRWQQKWECWDQRADRRRQPHPHSHYAHPHRR